MAHPKKNQLKKPVHTAITTPPTEDAVIKESNPAPADQPLLRKAFYGSLIVMLLITVISGYNVGFHIDEMDMNNYGKANVSYYLSGGADTSFLQNDIEATKVWPLMRY